MTDIFKKRRAVRNYSEKPIKHEQIKEILSAAMYAPSGYDKHPLSFFLVQNNQMKYKLAKTNQWSSYADRTSILIVVCADPKQSDVWLEDASIAAGYMWLKCAQMGIGACWIHIRDSKRLNGENGESYVKNLLKIPDHLRVVCFLAIGYPAVNFPEHNENEYSEKKIHYNNWGGKEKI